MAGVRRALPHAWALLIAVAMLLPGGVETPSIPHLDKLVHAAVFLVWTAVWRWCTRPPGVVVAFAVLALGCGTELTQLMVIPGRSGDWLDLLADLIGAALGWWLGGMLQRLTNPVVDSIENRS